MTGEREIVDSTEEATGGGETVDPFGEELIVGAEAVVSDREAVAAGAAVASGGEAISAGGREAVDAFGEEGFVNGSTIDTEAVVSEGEEVIFCGEESSLELESEASLALLLLVFIRKPGFGALDLRVTAMFLSSALVKMLKESNFEVGGMQYCGKTWWGKSGWDMLEHKRQKNPQQIKHLGRG